MYHSDKAAASCFQDPEFDSYYWGGEEWESDGEKKRERETENGCHKCLSLSGPSRVFTEPSEAPPETQKPNLRF